MLSNRLLYKYFYLKRYLESGIHIPHWNPQRNFHSSHPETQWYANSKPFEILDPVMALWAMVIQYMKHPEHTLINGLHKLCDIMRCNRKQGKLYVINKVSTTA